MYSRTGQLAAASRRSAVKLLGLTIAVGFTVATFAAIADADAISTAEQADKKAGISAPSIAEAKAIAEAGFIYGLPIVMNYAVMQEFSVDKNSGQFKAPFNTMYNDAAVFTYKDTVSMNMVSDGKSGIPEQVI